MYFIKLLYQFKEFVGNHLLYPEVIDDKQLALSAQISALENTLHPSQTIKVHSTTEIKTEPKKGVFEHWKHIEAIAERRFPNDKNLQLEASQYVLDALEADGWKKVRAFKGKSFIAFISTVTSNLLSDFWHKKFGKKRPNTWLTRQTDPIYQTAYRLLIKDKYSKRETIEILLTTDPKRERWFIQEIVEAVLANCPLKEEYQEVPFDENNENHLETVPSLEEQLEQWNEQALLETLAQFLNNDINEINNPLNKLLAVLGRSVRLTEEECLLLRLRYQSGLTANKIGTLVNLSASQVDKRIKKTLTRLGKTLPKQAKLSYKIGMN